MEETAGAWRKAERVLFGSPLSFLHSPALLPQSGNGGGREDSKRVSSQHAATNRTGQERGESREETAGAWRKAERV